MSRRPTGVAALAVLAVVLGCGDAPNQPTPGLHVLSGGTGSDTVMAPAPDFLRVEVRDASGAPAAGVTVKFLADVSAGQSDPNTASRVMFVCPVAGNACAATGYYQFGATGVTDASGLLSAKVQHGILAGAGTISITVPALGYATSATYETRPGNLARVVLASNDTAVYLGSSVTVAPKAADRYLNARTDAVTVEAATPSIATYAGGALTGVAYGRASFTLRSGTVSEVALVSVVPRGRLLVAGGPGDVTAGIPLALVNTDGSERRRFASSPGYQGYLYPAFSADSRKAFVLEPGTAAHLVAYDTASGARSLPIDTVAFPQSMDATFPSLGNVMYFYGGAVSGSSVLRAALDGTGSQSVLSGGGSPAISPDGSRLAYVRFADNMVVVRNLATGAENTVVPTSSRPRWSPDGEWLLYSIYSLGRLNAAVVHPDGTGARTIATFQTDPGSWSPDGQWVAVASPDAGIALVRVSDGLRLPIPGIYFPTQVAWRP